MKLDKTELNPKIMKIPNVKVRPTQNSFEITECLWPQQQEEGEEEEDDHHGYDYRRSSRHDYWQARRAFLKSYRFSEEDNNGFKFKLKRSVKGINEAAMGAVVEFRQGIMSKRKFAVRVFRIKIMLPSLVIVSMRCFVPWFKKVDMAQ